MSTGMPPMGDLAKTLAAGTAKSKDHGLNLHKRGNALTVEEACLEHLGVKNTNEINAWFIKHRDGNYRLDGLDRFKTIVDESINEDRDINIIGDYDVDGVMSLTIMYWALKEYIHNNYPNYDTNRIHYRAPYRFTEGFGFNTTMVDEIKNDNSLVITVDNGTVAFDAIEKAKERGMKVIITDHHEPNYDEQGKAILPEVELIINPHAIEDSADYDGYCGAGLAYKIALELNGNNAKKLRCFAAIATIADVMELKEDNYVIVRWGLNDLVHSHNPGVRALLTRLELTAHVSSSDVGFNIAPCINAPGRLEDKGANKAVQLFISEDKDEVDRLSAYLVSKNIERKQLTTEYKKNIDTIIHDQNMENDVPIILYIPGMSEGIVGIIAGQVTEKYNTPSIVFTDGLEKGTLKGSGRSPVGFMLKTALDRCKTLMEKDDKEDIIIRGGGHNGKIDHKTGEQTTGGAAGISIRKDGIEEFRKYFKEAAEEQDYEKTETKAVFDVLVDEKNLKDALETVDQFAPFGEGNPEIRVFVPDFTIIPQKGIYKKLIGIDGVRMTGNEFTVLGFGLADQLSETQEPTKAAMVVSLNKNYFNGNIYPQAEIKNITITDSLDKQRENPTPFKDALKAMADMRK